MERKTQTIDATDKSLGRLASEIVNLLRGKDKPDFLPSADRGDFVIVKNVEKLRLTGKKLKEKRYFRHSGYPGGLKEIKLETLFKENPQEVLRKAVWGMLPKNKLRKKIIKRLKFK